MLMAYCAMVKRVAVNTRLISGFAALPIERFVFMGCNLPGVLTGGFFFQRFVPLYQTAQRVYYAVASDLRPDVWKRGKPESHWPWHSWKI